MMILYCADSVYTNGGFQKNYAVLVKDDVIQDIGPADKLTKTYHGAATIDWGEKAIVPGTVNAHNHSFQSLLRGIAVDRPFLEWRDQALYKYTPLLDEEAIYTGALFAFGEMVKYGVTTVSDFFYVHNNGVKTDEAVIQAAVDVGIRLIFARTMYDWKGAPSSYQESVTDATKRTRELAIKYQGHPMVDVHPAPHSPHAASPEMIQASYQLAKELQTPFHIHVSEEMFEVEETLEKYNKRPVHYLDSLGVVDESMLAIHLVWLDQSEIDLLGKRKAGLAYCPSSNMFLSDGITSIPELVRSGVRVSLGSDGACSNNRISVFEEMRMCSLLQKVSTLDGTCMTANQVFQMGTKNGADLLQIDTGELAIGKKADFLAVDTSDLSLLPKHELFANLVYAMQPTAITDVIVAGKSVVQNRTVQTVSEQMIVKKVDHLFEKWGT
ncbi:amidohydrolase family protein [Shouchella lehensis]|uniref:Amidohydrolase n=1 Tax=Shouchella lehensis TaxID=300825 RepID=A0A4Y7WLA7_9BACI|nr:amidohydrolase [Shouchella lehensis]TES49358.1 amidohydrolase [Shouchella lehensis]